jgi:capsular polysaccharide transport system permease protein
MNFWSQISLATGTQGRVLHALMLREMKSRFGRQKLGYIWALLEPTVFVAVLALIFTFGRGFLPPPGMPLVPFLITGIVPFFLMRHTMVQTLGAIESNRVLLTFPQITPIDLVLGRALLEFATMTVVFFLLLAIAHMLGFTIRIQNPLQVLAALACLALTGLGIGAIFASLVPFLRTLERVIPMLFGRPLFFVSGVFFTSDMVPPGLRRELLLMNPIFHMLEWLRSGVFVEFESRYVSMQYVLGTVLVVVFLGLLMLRGLKKRILAAV